MKLFSIMMALCMMSMVISACSSSTVAKADPKETVTKAYQKLASLTNYHMTLDVTNSMTVQGKTMNSVVKGELDIQQNPMLCKNIMSISSEMDSRKNEQTITQYMEESGEKVIVYSGFGGKWNKQSMEKSDYNPLSDYDGYMKAITSVTQKSEDANSTVFEVIASGSALKEKMQEQLSKMNMKKDSITDDMLKDLGDLKYTVTVDKKSGYISKIDIDLSSFMSKLGNNLAASQQIPDNQKEMVKEMFTSMKISSTATLSNFNSAEKIIIPEEAKK